MVRRPSSSSLAARLTPSVSHWILLNLGTMKYVVKTVTQIRTATAAAVAAVHSQCLPEIITMAKAAVSGAFIIRVRPLAVNCISW